MSNAAVPLFIESTSCRGPRARQDERSSRSSRGFHSIVSFSSRSCLCCCCPSRRSRLRLPRSSRSGSSVWCSSVRRHRHRRPGRARGAGAAEPEPVRRAARRRARAGAVVERRPSPWSSRRPSIDTSASARTCARRRSAADRHRSYRRCATTSRICDRAETVGAGRSDTPFAERSLITSRVGTASGGINTAALSRNTGGGGLGGRTTTQVGEPRRRFCGGWAAPRSAAAPATWPRAVARRSSACSTRTKAASLRCTTVRCGENPALQGKVVLRLTISPGRSRDILRDRFVRAQRCRARA